VTDDHSSFDELADLDEGLLAPSRADEVRAHLVGCADCRDRHQALRDVHDELAVLPPETMPPDVAERLDRALADASTPRSATVVPIAQRQHRRRPGPALAGVAAVVVVLGFIVAIGVGALSGGSTSDGGSSGAGGASTAAGTHLPTSGHFTTTISPRTFTHASVPSKVSQLVESQAKSFTKATKTPLAPASGNPNSPTSGSDSGGGPVSTAVTGSEANLPKALLPLYKSPTKLVNCAAQVAPTPGSLPEAVIFGRYNGPAHKNTPSVFFVFADGPGRGDIVVVGPTCAGLDQNLDYFHGVRIR
jgi:hypothetical protein